MTDLNASDHLILIKHSLPDIQPNIPASHWQLSVEGRLRCHNLARSLEPFAPDRLVTSAEPKAVETGQIVAGLINRPSETVPDLHEHLRQREAFKFDPAEFQRQVANFFKQPGKLVYGDETANQAHVRFTDAVNRVLARYPAETLAIVAHGTVISLLVSRANPIDAFELWGQLGLPSYVVVSKLDFRLLKVVSTVNENS